MIYIVTVFKSYNYGSVLQARMLYKALGCYGKEIIYFDGGTRTYFEQKKFKNLLRAILKEKNFPKAKFLANEISQVIISWHRMKSTKKIEDNDTNIVVLGSDEIWNVAREECKYDIFFASGFGGKILSYAPSINNTTQEQFTEYSATSNIDSYSGISVRDFYSKSVVSGVTNKEISVVLDPTMLFDYQAYAEGSLLQKIGGKYIAVYLFESKLISGEIKAIKRFAQEHNLNLISLGKWIDWCDECIPAVDGNPFLYYKDAEYVITNTFHGTAFAINFEKQFVTFTRNNRKVRELIEMFELSDRDVCGCTPEMIQKRFDGKIDYEKVTGIKHNLRKASFEYIKKAIQ